MGNGKGKEKVAELDIESFRLNQYSYCFHQMMYSFRRDCDVISSIILYRETEMLLDVGEEECQVTAPFHSAAVSSPL